MYIVTVKKQVYIMFVIYITVAILGYIGLKYKKTIFNAYLNGFEKYNQLCLLYDKSHSAREITRHRGIFYWITSDVKDNHDKKILTFKRRFCLTTFWSMTHVFMYTIIGFFCPQLFIPSFMIGLFFEAFEKKFCNCHDILDIFYNSFGFGIGYLLNKLFYGTFKLSVKISSIIIIIVFLVGIYHYIVKIEEYQNKNNEVNKNLEINGGFNVINDVDEEELHTINEKM